ncbi:MULTISPECIES: TadE/TadG family type IV pilus assembly protein [unclassified Hyphomonas]|uniref:TadE/TadG family type IV pilus assembly protein n=1 Tax=unclassified Hyphomonas TaxID=2630699 RepID=UPI001A8CC6AF|nr:MULTISPECIES: TadE/TadG family type IV pilus assembly protein [unclassified Hyphomonas]|tara:strand:+ start:5447 stop:6883 length:1437 start_codon:yes stop_codon:yes gene_type:complete
MMTNTNLIKRTVETIRRFKDETQGNIAIIFALMTIPLFLLMGFAIDLQQVNTAKNRVQFILDSAVIAGAREMQEGKNDTEIKTYIENYFKSAMKAQGKGTDCAEPVASIAAESQDLSVKVRCAQPTSIMQMTGTKELNFSVTSASTYGIGKVDIAFVFDISGSMGGTKMSALKSAADTAINVLVPADDDGTTGEVRIGMASYSSMVDAGEDYFFKATGQLPIRTYTFSYDETYESGGDWEEVCKWKKKRGRWYWTCDDEWVPNYATRTVTETKTINNTCVKERVGDEQFTDEDPGPFQWIEAAEAYGSVNWRGDVSWYTESCNPIGPLPMTSNRDKLFDYIDGLNASGGTAGHLGIAWGWYLIAPDWDVVWPAGSDPYPYDEPDSAKAMIIMTDGEFNQEYDTSNGDSFDQAETMCDAIKDQGIKVYTVAFQAPPSGQAILNYCASGDDFAFTPESSEELTEAYTKIAQSISDLRIRY